MEKQMAQIAAAAAETTHPKGPSLLARVFGVLFSPRETYAAVAARPRALGALTITLVVMIGCQSWFMSTDVGKEAVLEQQVRTLESFGMTVSDEMYAQMESRLAYGPYTTAASLLVFVPLVTALVAVLLVGIFSMLLGGAASFKQAYAVVAHAGVIIAVQQLFGTPLSYARGEFAGANLSVFVPMLEETAFLTLFLGAIDLFLVWWVVSLAIGVGVLYKRKTGPIATSLLLVYILIALVLAFVRS
jgi:hypothetical protein